MAGAKGRGELVEGHYSRVYVDEPTGGRLNVGGIRKEGKVEVWGVARRDEQLGDPVGLRYMQEVVKFLEKADIAPNGPNAAEWHVRYEEKALIPLKEMLSRKKEWPAAIQQLIGSLRAIEHRTSD